MKFRTFFLAYMLIAPAVSITDAAAETRPAGYYLSIDEGSAGSEALLRGDYAAAIDAAQGASRAGRNLSAYLTLCAAYIRSNALESAVAACDKAVELASTPVTTLRNPYGRTNREALAKAYLNRGVLRMAQGEIEAANADFERALDQDRELEAVRHNLRLNESRLALVQQRK